MALPRSGQDVVFYRAHTGRQTLPSAPVSECWIEAGRRAGKSHVAALTALWLALRFDAETLAPGEVGVVPIIAADRRQARAVFRYLTALSELDDIRGYIHRRSKESISTHTGVDIEIHTASYRTIRGYTIIGAVLDEIAFWRDESTSVNPDSEILDALRPGMATVPGSLLFAISSPYGRRGELYAMHERYYGVEDRTSSCGMPIHAA